MGASEGSGAVPAVHDVEIDARWPPVAGLAARACGHVCCEACGRLHRRAPPRLQGLGKVKFTPANVGVWRTALALETGDYDAIPSLTRQVDRSELRTKQRRAHLLMNAGRGYFSMGGHKSAVRAILEADEIAPAEVRSRPTIREVVGAMSREAFRGSELATLTARVGINPYCDKPAGSHHKCNLCCLTLAALNVSGMPELSLRKLRRAALMDDVAGVVPLGGDVAVARSVLATHTRRWVAGKSCRACGEAWPCAEYAAAWRVVAAYGEGAPAGESE